jgi:hypothetical protein
MTKLNNIIEIYLFITKLLIINNIDTDKRILEDTGTLSQYDAKILVLISEANEEELFNNHKSSMTGD